MDSEDIDFLLYDKKAKPDKRTNTSKRNAEKARQTKMDIFKKKQESKKKEKEKIQKALQLYEENNKTPDESEGEEFTDSSDDEEIVIRTVPKKKKNVKIKGEPAIINNPQTGGDDLKNRLDGLENMIKQITAPVKQKPKKRNKTVININAPEKKANPKAQGLKERMLIKL